MGGKAFVAGGRHRVVFPGVMIILDGASVWRTILREYDS
jgi:hypothetical protein